MACDETHGVVAAEGPTFPNDAAAAAEPRPTTEEAEADTDGPPVLPTCARRKLLFLARVGGACGAFIHDVPSTTPYASSLQAACRVTTGTFH